MSIIEAIRMRESVRTYTGDRLSKEQIDEIEQFVEQIKAPFGVEARIKLISSAVGEKTVKLGTVLNRRRNCLPFSKQNLTESYSSLILIFRNQMVASPCLPWNPI